MMNFNGLRFELTCGACPEQYDVYKDENLVGYVRLRWGRLRCDYPDVGGETIYEYCFEEDDGFKGCFNSDEERDFHLTEISKALTGRLERELADADSRID
jgi:hypothetical protein